MLEKSFERQKNVPRDSLFWVSMPELSMSSVGWFQLCKFRQSAFRGISGNTKLYQYVQNCSLSLLEMRVNYFWGSQIPLCRAVSQLLNFCFKTLNLIYNNVKHMEFPSHFVRPLHCNPNLFCSFEHSPTYLGCPELFYILLFVYIS